MRPILLKRVKSFGSCQSVIGAHFVIAKEPPTQRHRGAAQPIGRKTRRQHRGRRGGHRGHGEELRRLTRPLVARSSPYSPRVLCGLRVGVFFLRLQRPFRGSSGARESMRVNLLMRRRLLAKLPGRRGNRTLNIKDLLTASPVSVGPTPAGFGVRLKRGKANLLIPRWLLAKLVSRTAEALLNLKDLLTVFPLSGQVTFSGFGGQLGRGSVYLLIAQGLPAKVAAENG